MWPLKLWSRNLNLQSPVTLEQLRSTKSKTLSLIVSLHPTAAGAAVHYIRALGKSFVPMVGVE